MFFVFTTTLVALGAGVGLYYNRNDAPRTPIRLGRAIGVHRVVGRAAGLAAPAFVAAIGTVRD